MKLNLKNLKITTILCILLIYFAHKIECENVKKIENPKIVIIGAGASGIAAASKLYENGLTNIVILEAENRTGGRIFTSSFGDYLVEIGGEWVHGAKNNVVYDLASPYGLIETSEESSNMPEMVFVDSSGNSRNEKKDDAIQTFSGNFVVDPNFCPNTTYESIGECITKTFEQNFKEDRTLMKEGLKYLHDFELLYASIDSAETWFDIASKKPFTELEGGEFIHWKKGGYFTVLDILMKRYPNPEKNLPIQTVLNSEVKSIDYSKNSQKSIIITTTKNQIFEADHVVMTVSLGVLKEKHETLFIPRLPAHKKMAIEKFGFGNVAKIFLLYDKPFWSVDNTKFSWTAFLWDEDDRKLIKSDPERSWLLGIRYVRQVKRKSNVLALWVALDHARHMEALSDSTVLEHSVEVLNLFLGKDYNVTRPIAMRRSQWHSNPHFRGTYSYRSIAAHRNNLNVSTLEEPLNDLSVLFAGEATSLHRYGCVDGAIRSGWSAANKLLNHYKKM